VRVPRIRMQMAIKITAVMLMASLALALLAGGPAAAEQEPADLQGKGGPKVEAPPEPSPPSDIKVVYVPPKRGAPDGRVSGGTRGAGPEGPVLSALAPDHTGLTAQEQPTLFWFLSNPTTQPLRLTITDDQAGPPLIDSRLTPPISPGIQGVRLADHGVRLLPGIHYRWLITLVPDPDHPSAYIFAGGAIERRALPEQLSKKLAGASQLEVAALFAKEGFWYDAVTTLSEMIHAAPQDPNLRAQRAGLLEQVGLPEAAAYDVSQAIEKK
jgi:hypothetical protein